MADKVGTYVRTIARKSIEHRVLTGIKDKLLSPELIAVFVREFTEEWNRRIAGQRQGRAGLEAELADVNRGIGQIIEAIEQSIITATTKDRLLELEARRDKLNADLAKAAASAPPPTLHPNLAEVYRRKVADLETALDDALIHGEAALALRGLIDAVVLYPGEKRGEAHAELHGELAALTALEATKAKTRTSRDVRCLVGCGGGFEPLTCR